MVVVIGALLAHPRSLTIITTYAQSLAASGPEAV